MPELDALLGGVTEGPGHGLSREQLEDMVREAFSDEMRFKRYVCRLPRLSMPGVDQVRFEHLVALVHGGRGEGTLRPFVALVAAGLVPGGARPFVYGGRG